MNLQQISDLAKHIADLSFVVQHGIKDPKFRPLAYDVIESLCQDCASLASEARFYERHIEIIREEEPESESEE
jgi:hypothetical protein